MFYVYFFKFLILEIIGYQTFDNEIIASLKFVEIYAINV